ncbi:type II toxin-antitoxin system RelE/ParE family toxin [Vibrio diabolicus]|uniref:type II toxin-antitoxin system RelE family toxin n=1 Tax=Vibrio harveyi group TaxID=717610 RepID=UPI0013036507|nr:MULTISPECIES: type II toxin-antitoxin system RelE/ParE family toxin [Vibrio harveyi group]MCS0383032.1 type II toxin-antitoxin system RelE/ParE family toxin [Vibrio diabolicus]
MNTPKYRLAFDKAFTKDLKKLPKQNIKQLISYLKDVAQLEDAKSRGKPLRWSLAGLWRYRVGDYRIICDVQEGEMLILALSVKSRKEVYIKK